LGLYIAAEIARSHGGAMQVESTEAAGTTFTFVMPLAPDQRS
ncbi:ATP-binding protein, partial [Escherichia coli]|nr:ATP-binding protein [Escherichia coli]